MISRSDLASTGTGQPRWQGRLIAAVALLIAEYVLITWLFDARALLERRGGGSILAYVGDVGSIALVAAAAVLCVLGPALRDALATAASGTRQERHTWPNLLLHVLVFGAFVGVTQQVFGRGSSEAPSIFWSVGWVAASAAVMLSWLPIALPRSALGALRPRLWASVWVGASAGAAAWLGGQATTLAWKKLAPLTFGTVSAALRLVVHDVAVDEAKLEIGTRLFRVQVAPVCSGFEGIGMILVFLGGYLAVERKNLRFPQVLVLLPLAVATVWIANAARVTALILIGSYVSPELAIGGFHSKAGWLLFCAIALGFAAVARNSRQFSISTASDLETEPNPAVPYLMPILTLFAASLVTGLVTLGFDLLYPLRITCILVVLFLNRAHYRRLAWDLSGWSVAIGFAVFALWYLLARGGTAAETRELARGLKGLGPVGSALWTAARIAGACVVVPLAEELAFRGYLLRRLVDADFMQVDARKYAWFAWLASSLAFGLLHQDWLAATIAGLGYALAQQRRGRVSDAVIAHAITNLLLAIDAVFLGHLHWWA